MNEKANLLVELIGPMGSMGCAMILGVIIGLGSAIVGGMIL